MLADLAEQGEAGEALHEAAHIFVGQHAVRNAPFSDDCVGMVGAAAHFRDPVGRIVRPQCMVRRSRVPLAAFSRYGSASRSPTVAANGSARPRFRERR